MDTKHIVSVIELENLFKYGHPVDLVDLGKRNCGLERGLNRPCAAAATIYLTMTYDHY